MTRWFFAITFLLVSFPGFAQESPAPEERSVIPLSEVLGEGEYTYAEGRFVDLGDEEIDLVVVGLKHVINGALTSILGSPEMELSQNNALTEEQRGSLIAYVERARHLQQSLHLNDAVYVPETSSELMINLIHGQTHALALVEMLSGLTILDRDTFLQLSAQTIHVFNVIELALRIFDSTSREPVSFTTFEKFWALLKLAKDPTIYREFPNGAFFERRPIVNLHLIDIPSELLPRFSLVSFMGDFNLNEATHSGPAEFYIRQGHFILVLPYHISAPPWQTRSKIGGNLNVLLAKIYLEHHHGAVIRHSPMDGVMVILPLPDDFHEEWLASQLDMLRGPVSLAAAVQTMRQAGVAAADLANSDQMNRLVEQLSYDVIEKFPFPRTTEPGEVGAFMLGHPVSRSLAVEMDGIYDWAQEVLSVERWDVESIGVHVRARLLEARGLR